MTRSQAHPYRAPSRLRIALEEIAAGVLFVALCLSVLFFLLLIPSGTPAS